MDKYLEANAIFSKFSVNFLGLRKDLPIRPSELGVLNIIVHSEEKYTPLMLAELLEVSKPMVTAYIVELEKEGYIYKEKSKEDKRSYYVMPTEKAVKLVNATTKKMNEGLQQIEAAIGETGFKELMKRLAEVNKILIDIRKNDIKRGKKAMEEE